MLVLSRRPSEKILFPNLGITVQVVRVDSKRVKLGIDAPADISVLRGELACDIAPAGTNGISNPRKLNHQLRNLLNTVTVGLHLLQRKLELGHTENADETISSMLSDLRKMDDQFAVGEPTFGSVQKPRALLVDDSKNESELLAGYLQTFGYEVFIVADGVDALEFLASQTRPDVILLDMNMPRMSGQDAIANIRANPAHDGIKVFAVSGVSQVDAGIEIGPGGVDRWFTKPIQPQVLIKELRRELSSTSV